MNLRLHANATTTPKIRAYIQASQASDRALARELGISVDTVRRWRKRDTVHDASHTPHRLPTTLSPLEEIIVVELRRTLLLSLDDLLVVTREMINPAASRSGLARCLDRHGVGKVSDLIPQVEGEPKPVKTFKDYEPGFVHIDIKYLPQMPDEDARRYLFVAIDRATRWVFLRIYDDQTEASSTDFLRRLVRASPMRIVKVLTDNGSQFTDRFTSKNKKPSGQHAFDLECGLLGMEHRLTPPRHPQTNGMVERFNGRISDLIRRTRFCSARDLEQTLQRYLLLYNQHIPQKAIDHRTPMQALKQWYKDRPELFVKPVRNLRGPNM